MQCSDELRSLAAGGDLDPEARRRLQAILTVSPASDIPADVWPALDALWTAEAACGSATESRDLPRLILSGVPAALVSLWRGDITRLRIDAIVNAANAGLTGCYLPFHACVDNAIHSAAGPRLRLACERVMEERGRPEPTATATLTEAFHLPAAHVVHTVGPIVPDGRPTREQREQLSACYRRAILRVAERSLTGIAFPAIATGVFGYPKAAAAEVVVETVTQTLAELGARAPHVVLVAYAEPDEVVYRDAFARAGAEVAR